MDTKKKIQVNLPYWLYDYLMDTKKFYRVDTLSDIVIYHLAVSLKYLLKIMHPELEGLQGFKFEDWLKKLRDDPKYLEEFQNFKKEDVARMLGDLLFDARKITEQRMKDMESGY
jgi:hypothetical protein